MSPNNFTEGDLLKIECWLPMYITAVGSPAPDRAEREILLGVILDIFGQFSRMFFLSFQAASVAGEPLCDVEIPS